MGRGIASDKKQRGTSINVDCYSYDQGRGLAVVQVRQCQFRPGRFNRVRKDYYLIGTNENGNAFAHPIETVARSKKTFETAEAGVLLALSRIWNCKTDEVDYIVRNGDVAFVPVVRVPATAQVVEGNQITVRESHHVKALADSKIYRDADGTIYVKGIAKIEHSKGQHPTAKVKGGSWRVVAGARAATWGFSSPTAD